MKAIRLSYREQVDRLLDDEDGGEPIVRLELNSAEYSGLFYSVNLHGRICVAR